MIKIKNDKELAEYIKACNDYLAEKAEPMEQYVGPKIVVYGGTRNIYDNMLRSAKSLIYHTDVDKVYFLIEDDKIDCPEPLPDNFEFINVSDQQYFPTFGPNYEQRWSYMTLMRLALYSMFPQYNRVLWLDSDTYVLSDIGELFEAPLGDKYYAGLCEEIEHYVEYAQVLRKEGSYLYRTPSKFIRYPYYNAGVVLFNLEKLRDGTGNAMLDSVNERHKDCPDQDIINEYCRGHIYSISSAFNASIYTEIPEFTKIYHYSGLDTDDITLALNEKYEGLTFKDITNWRNTRKEYMGSVRIKD